MADQAYCIIPGCIRSYPNHKWGSMKAARDGWFFSKQDGAYCPDHIPDWVAQWRENKKEQGLGTLDDDGSR